MGNVKKYFDAFRYNNRNTELFQYIFSFCFGVMFGAISLGVLWLIVFIAFYEVVYCFLVGGEYPYWIGYVRVNVELLCVVGWLLGRWAMLRIDPIREFLKKEEDEPPFSD